MKARTPTVLLVGGLLVVALLALDQPGGMDSRFFFPSPPAMRALIHYLVGDYGGAARLYREALYRDASRTPSPALTSRDALVRGELDEAATRARAEARAMPGDPEPLLTLAEVGLLGGDLVTAAAHAARVLELRRDDYDALLITAVAEARQGHSHAAITALTRALRYDRIERRFTVFLAVLEVTGELESRPIHERPNCLLAHLHRYLRIFDASHARPALRYAQRAIETEDDVDAALVTLGVVHIKQRHPTRALAAFERARTANPRNTGALLAAARLREDRGELDEAYRLVRAALGAGRDDPFVMAAVHAFLMDRLGDYPQALALADAALSANPQDAEAWWRRGYVQTQLGNHREALASYQHAAALIPLTAELAVNIAIALAELGDTKAAFAAYRQAIALDPSAPQPHLGLGILHGKDRHWNEAIAEFETAARLGGGLPVGLCELYLETGRHDAAARCATAILTVDPDNFQGRAVMEHARGAQQSASRGR